MLEQFINRLANRLIGINPEYEYQEYTTGSGSWTVPAGIYTVDVMIVGAGGGGGAGQNGNTRGGGGGSSGNCIMVENLPVTPAENISYSIGSGGAGATTGGANGSNGGNSTFGSAIAYGGNGGIGGGTQPPSGGARPPRSLIAAPLTRAFPTLTGIDHRTGCEGGCSNSFSNMTSANGGSSIDDPKNIYIAFGLGSELVLTNGGGGGGGAGIGKGGDGGEGVASGTGNDGAAGGIGAGGGGGSGSSSGWADGGDGGDGYIVIRWLRK